MSMHQHCLNAKFKLANCFNEKSETNVLTSFSGMVLASDGIRIKKQTTGKANLNFSS